MFILRQSWRVRGILVSWGSRVHHRVHRSTRTDLCRQKPDFFFWSNVRLSPCLECKWLIWIRIYLCKSSLLRFPGQIWLAVQDVLPYPVTAKFLATLSPYDLTLSSDIDRLAKKRLTKIWYWSNPLVRVERRSHAYEWTKDPYHVLISQDFYIKASCRASYHPNRQTWSWSSLVLIPPPTLYVLPLSFMRRMSPSNSSVSTWAKGSTSPRRI